METLKTIDKKADADYQIIEGIANRWSPRSFDNKKVDEEILFRLFEAARWSASSMNEQPWRFIYAFKDSQPHEKIADTLMPGNKPWAQEAPVLLLTVVKTHFSKNNAPNRTAMHDLGLAVGNLSIQATHEGIGLHQMGGFSPEKAKAAFDIPDDYQVVTAIAMGYFGKPDQLPEDLYRREIAQRTRKPIKEFAFEGVFTPS